jgi:hypothetical protein
MSKKNLRFLSAATAFALTVFTALAFAPETRDGNFILARAAAQQRGIVCLDTAFLEEQYDKMGDRTTVKFNPVRVKDLPASREIGVFADFSYPGHNFSAPAKITLGFVHAALAETLNSDFASNRNLTLTIGGEQIPLGQMGYDKKEKTGLAGKIQLEIMSVEVQPSVFVRLARATQATVRLGQTEFNLEDKQLKELRKIVERARLN